MFLFNPVWPQDLIHFQPVIGLIFPFKKKNKNKINDHSDLVMNSSPSNQDLSSVKISKHWTFPFTSMISVNWITNTTEAFSNPFIRSLFSRAIGWNNQHALIHTKILLQITKGKKKNTSNEQSLQQIFYSNRLQNQKQELKQKKKG